MTHRLPNRFPIVTSLDVGGAGLEQSKSGGRNVFLKLQGGMETEDGQGHFVDSHDVKSIANTFPYVHRPCPFFDS